MGFLNFLIDLFGLGTTSSESSFEALAQGGAIQDSSPHSIETVAIVLAMEEEMRKSPYPKKFDPQK